ncbi:MAG: ABC transporter permease [Bifidobacterium adolescentis]
MGHGGRGTHQFRTLKALGYGNADVMLKFTVYGFAASTLGTCIGVLAGHAAAAYRRPRIQRGIHHAGHHAQIPPRSPWPHSHLHG